MLKRFFKNVDIFIKRIMSDNLGLYAAQASFFIIFSVTPCIMLMLTLAKYFLPIDLDQILNEIYAHIPAEIASILSSIIVDAFDTSIGLISVSAVSTLWLASKGIMALYLGLDNVFKPDKPRNYFYARFISVIYTIIFILAMVLTIVVFGFGGSIMTKLESTLIFPFINKLFEFRLIFFLAILTLIFASFYKFLPQKNNSFRRQLPGAALAAFSWIAFSFIYSIYIERFSNYSYVYGSLAAVIFLMLWLYICMNILLYGAEFNMLIEERVFFTKKSTQTTKTDEK